MMVLVVDDDEDLREAICVALEDAGFTVGVAADGLEALAKSRREKPDVILLDLRMPVMDGVEFRRRQLLDSEIAGIPVIVMTAMREPWHLGLSAAALIEKPVGPDALFGAIRAARAS